MHWEQYKSYIINLFRDNGLKGPAKKDDWGQVFRNLCDDYTACAISEKQFGDEIRGVASEYLWWKDSAPCLFLESSDLVDMISHARFSVKATDLRFPFCGTFSIAFPTQKGVAKNHPVLFSAHSPRMVSREMGLGDTLSASDNRAFILSTNIGGRYLSACYTESHTDELFDGSIDRFIFKHKDDVPLIEWDSRETAKFALRLCAYLTAFPDALREGFPERMKERHVHHALRANVVPRTITLAKEVQPPTGTHASPIPHWRSCHFRTLRHPRYKREEDGRPRIIFVRDSIVSGKDSNAKTAVKVI